MEGRERREGRRKEEGYDSREYSPNTDLTDASQQCVKVWEFPHPLESNGSAFCSSRDTGRTRECTVTPMQHKTTSNYRRAVGQPLSSVDFLMPRSLNAWFSKSLSAWALKPRMKSQSHIETALLFNPGMGHSLLKMNFWILSNGLKT